MTIDPRFLISCPGAIDTGGITMSGDFNLYPIKSGREKRWESHWWSYSEEFIALSSTGSGFVEIFFQGKG